MLFRSVCCGCKFCSNPCPRHRRQVKSKICCNPLNSVALFCRLSPWGLSNLTPRTLDAHRALSRPPTRAVACLDLLNQPPCAVRSRTPYLLGFAYGQPPFSGLATQQRPAPGYFPRPSARRLVPWWCSPFANSDYQKATGYASFYCQKGI